MAMDFLEQPTQNPMAYAQQVENMYPDVYKAIMPYINTELATAGQSSPLTEDALNQMTYRVVNSSNILSRLPHGHNEHTVNDIVKVLLLASLYNQYGEDPAYYPYPYQQYPYPYPVYPPFYFPFFGGFGNGGMRGFHGGGFHGGGRR